MAKVYAGIPREAGAFWQYLREIAYERRVRLALFRLDIDHVLILIFGHLAQEFLKLAAAFSAYPALQFCQRFILTSASSLITRASMT
jgi:hypothetical protein